MSGQSGFSRNSSTQVADDLYSGYTESCQNIVSASRKFADALRTRFPLDLYVLGDPKVCVVAFGSHTLNIYAVGDKMSEKGWHLSALSKPAALHMAFTVSALPLSLYALCSLPSVDMAC
jgi:glutamate/tyrosine decarboxylase-like PLP-dependent enzyme